MNIVPQIRWMIRRDMNEIMRIEKSSFEYPWPLPEFIGTLATRNCIGMVADIGQEPCGYGPVAGYMVYELQKSRLHLLNLAVDESYRECGVGRAMMEKLIGKLSHDRRKRITAEVRETNLGAQLFFRKIGFKAVSVLRGYYQDSPGEDAYVFQYHVNQRSNQCVSSC